MTAMEGTSSQAFAQYKPFIKELQNGFWKILSFFVLGAILGMVYYKQILSLLMGLFNFENINIVLTSPYQFINLSINTGFFVGVVFSSPIFIYYLLRFIKPALKPKEYRLLLQLLPASVALFLIGFGFGIWVLQYVVDLFSSASRSLAVSNIWDLSGFISQVIIMGLSLALVFQMPIVITILLRLHIVKHDVVAAKRRVAYAVILLFAAMMPPTDLVSMAILALVPVFLFEITLFINWHNAH
jgi:sec-independent protein translocase protein TatC